MRLIDSSTTGAARRTTRAGALAAATLALALTGCGAQTSSTTAGDSTASPSPSTSTPASSNPTTPSSSSSTVRPTVPDCGDVWTEGKRLASSYRGCMSGAHKVPGHAIVCEQGNRLYYYANTYWALAGKPVHKAATVLKDDHAFRALVRSCTG